MGFSTVDSIVNALSVNLLGQRLSMCRTMASVSVANVPHTLWKSTGATGAGTDTSIGKANGRTDSQSSTGAVKYTDATGPATMHLITLAGLSLTSSATGSLYLVDRMAEVQLAHAETTGAITGVDASTRMASTTAPGDGGQLWCEVTSALSAASNTITFQATDQLGNTATNLSGMVTVASAVAGRSPNALLWQKLANAVTGIRALTNVTLTSGSATGDYDACIVRPLGSIPLVAIASVTERDFIVEVPNIPKLFDDTCFTWIYVPTAAVTATICGEFRICQN